MEVTLLGQGLLECSLRPWRGSIARDQKESLGVPKLCQLWSFGGKKSLPRGTESPSLKTSPFSSAFRGARTLGRPWHHKQTSAFTKPSHDGLTRKGFALGLCGKGHRSSRTVGLSFKVERPSSRAISTSRACMQGLASTRVPGRGADEKPVHPGTTAPHFPFLFFQNKYRTHATLFPVI